jgi:hypothetical protein
MTEIIFSLKFYSQLKRTRPAVVETLQSVLRNLVEETGGTVEREGKIFVAHFNDTSFAFWLEMVQEIQNFLATLRSVSRELFGHVVIIQKMGEKDAETCISLLSRTTHATGVWCDDVTRCILLPYFSFEDASTEGYTQVTGIRSFHQRRVDVPAATYKPVFKELSEASQHCKAIIGEDEQILTTVMNLFLKNFDNDLVMRCSFGCNGGGIGCLLEGLYAQEEIKKSHVLSRLYTIFLAARNNDP